MQGRLSDPIQNKIQAFPYHSWKEEFYMARKIEVDCIEWVFDSYSKNPIIDHDRCKEILTISEKNCVLVNSVCADFFMENLLFDVSEFDLEKNLRVLKKLIENCSNINIPIIEIPLVDSSSVKLKKRQDQIIKNLEVTLSVAQENNVMIAIESDLAPNCFKNFLSNFNHPLIKANYDIGNSTANGYDAKLELSTLKPWIINVHVKDRMRNGGTVPLGKGNSDFETFFLSLAEINYSGDLIIQGAREDLEKNKINPHNTCEKYLMFVKQYVDKYLT